MESSVMEQDEGLQDRIREFRDFADSTYTARALAEKCRAYKNGDQLSEDELKALKKRKQPPVIDNKIQDKCDTLIGIEQQTRTDPKAYPRTPQHEEAADAATDALRYIKDDNAFTEVTTAAFDNLIIEGLCAGEVIVEVKKDKTPDVKMRRIRWDRLYYDPHSLELDYSDATYKGFSTWMDSAQAERDWKDKKDALTSCFNNSLTDGDTFDDRPRFAVISGKRKRVQIFTVYYRENGTWMYAVWCLGGYLEGPKPSPYQNDDGEPDCCIELQAVYKDQDGNPFGAVPRWLDPQDELNKRRSKMLHLLNTKQIHAEKGAYPDIKKAREQLHAPDGVMEYTPGMKSEIVTNLELAQGQFQLLQYTDHQLSATGPNAALMGQSGHLSGRAKQLDQQSGSLQTVPLTNALRSWKLRMYRHAWNRVRQYWTAEMWVRVTDDEDNIKFVGLNQPVTQGDVMAEQLKAADMPPEQKQQMVHQMAQDPNMRQPVMENGKPKLKNNVAEMDVDIIIDEAPDTITVQSEEYAQLVDLAKSKAVQIPPKALIGASQLRSQTKKMIIDQMSGDNDPMAKMMAEMQQKMAELEVQLKQANIAKIESEIKKNEAAATETGVDASVKMATFTTADLAVKEQVTVS